MKALTVRQPWASLIVAGLKRVENRTWRTNYRGSLVIHAAARVDPDAPAVLESAGIDPQAWQDAPRGVLLGMVDLIDVIDLAAAGALAHDPLVYGPYCWILANPRPLSRPIPARGHRTLWSCDRLLQRPENSFRPNPLFPKGLGSDFGKSARFSVIAVDLYGRYAIIEADTGERP